MAIDGVGVKILYVNVSNFSASLPKARVKQELMGTVHLVLHLNGYELRRVALINRCPQEGRYTLCFYKDFGERKLRERKARYGPGGLIFH